VHQLEMSMKKVYVCGSFRFLKEMEELEERLKGENLEYEISKERDSHGILGCLEKIDEADILYVVNPGGYVGRSLCFDLGYAYAKNKMIYAMHPIEDPPLIGLIKGVLTFEDLINFLKRNM
jgi:diphthamide synthase subunit DPH2